ncbi:hypothetical protein PCK1_001926 [Pneumocystis canis]|nr:hypothetical protein PCK1_001926 [Pneumocystis canis]
MENEESVSICPIRFLLESFKKRMNIEKKYVEQLKELGKELNERKNPELKFSKDIYRLIESILETASTHETFVKKAMNVITIFSKNQNGLKMYVDKKNETEGNILKQKTDKIAQYKIGQGKVISCIWEGDFDISAFEKLQFTEKLLLRRILIELKNLELEYLKKNLKNVKKSLKFFQQSLKKKNGHGIFNNKLGRKLRNKGKKFSGRKNDNLRILYSKLKFKMTSIFKRKKSSQIDTSLKRNFLEKSPICYKNNLDTTNLTLTDVFEVSEKNSLSCQEKDLSIKKSSIPEREMLKTIKIHENNISCFDKDKFANIGFKKYEFQNFLKKNLITDVLEKTIDGYGIEKTIKMDFIEQENYIEIQRENSSEIQNSDVSELKIVTQIYEKSVTSNEENNNCLETNSIYNTPNQLLLKSKGSVSSNLSQTSNLLNTHISHLNTIDSFMINKLNYIILSKSNMLLLDHKHIELTKQGLNFSIIEVVNACIKNNEPIEFTIQGEIAFSCTQKIIFENFFPKLAIQINGSENFLKIMFNKNILKNTSNNPPRYLLNFQQLSQMTPILRYQIIININKTSFQPILVTSQWKHIYGESSIIITYRKNPFFFQSESTLVLQDLSFIVGPENVLIKACQTKPEGTFYKRQNKLIFSLGNKILCNEKEEKLFAKFETDGLASESSINVIWKISPENLNTMDNWVVITASNSFSPLDLSSDVSDNSLLNSNAYYPLFTSRIIQSGVYTIF